jgi:hypothetical protein
MSAPREGNLRRPEEGGTAEASRSRLSALCPCATQLMFVSETSVTTEVPGSSKFCSNAMHCARNLHVFSVDNGFIFGIGALWFSRLW